jgi:hypothetical protein
VGRPDVAARIEAVCEYRCGKHAGDISTPGGESSNCVQSTGMNPTFGAAA